MITVELLTSVISPDAGHVLTILVSSKPLEVPYKDKSVAMNLEERAHSISVKYGGGGSIVIPWANIRYITIEPEVQKKKEPHQVPPYFRRDINGNK